MGAQQTTLASALAAQLKIVAKNRRADGRARKDAAMTEEAVAALFMQIQLEYPFMQSVTDSAIVTNHSLPDEPIIYCNDEFTQLTGYPKEEILGRNCRFLQGKHTDPKHVQLIRNAIREGVRLEIELLNYRKDGTPFLNGFCMLPLHEKGHTDGKIGFFLAIQKNVTVIVNPFRAPMNSWSVPEVAMWLEKIGAASYCKTFIAQDISGSMLEAATPEKLQMLGVVLQAEQRRIIAAIKADKQTRQETNRRAELMAPGADDSTSMDVDTEVARAFRSRPATSPAASFGGGDVSPRARDELSESEVELDKQLLHDLKAATSAGSSTMRKIVIAVKFPNDLRPPLRVVVSTASPSLSELKKALRKKTGRVYNVLSLTSPGGLVKELVMEVQPGNARELTQLSFAVLDGLRAPVFVTDNAGIIVFGNDALCELARGDVENVHVLKLFQMNAPADKMDLVSELAGGVAPAGTGPDGVLRSFQVSPVKIGKCNLHVWLVGTAHLIAP